MVLEPCCFREGILDCGDQLIKAQNTPLLIRCSGIISKNGPPRWGKIQLLAGSLAKRSRYFRGPVGKQLSSTRWTPSAAETVRLISARPSKDSRRVQPAYGGGVQVPAFTFQSSQTMEVNEAHLNSFPHMTHLQTGVVYRMTPFLQSHVGILRPTTSSLQNA